MTTSTSAASATSTTSWSTRSVSAMRSKRPRRLPTCQSAVWRILTEPVALLLCGPAEPVARQASREALEGVSLLGHLLLAGGPGREGKLQDYGSRDRRLRQNHRPGLEQTGARTRRRQHPPVLRAFGLGAVEATGDLDG